MALPLIELKNVDVALDGNLILHRIHWRLRPRENWAILGENGSGKSTFLRLIRGELWPAPGSPGRRVYRFGREEQTTAVGIKEVIALVSPELQHRYLQQEWRLTGLQVVQSGFGGGDYVYQTLDRAQKQAAEHALTLTDAAHLAGRNVQEVSTGELRRILVARALVSSPRVLVCDEICDGLDAENRARLLQALDRIARGGTQLLSTTHRPEEFIPSLTHQLVLKGGRIVAQGRMSTLRPLTSPALAGADIHHPLDGPRPRRSVPVRQTSACGPVLIRIERADVYLGLKRVLHNIHWEWRRGEHWAVLGPNGAGKTTFLKLVCGDLHPALGSRVRRFEFTSRNTIWEVKRRIGFVSPELQANYRDAVTGADVVASGFFSSVGLMRRPSTRQRERAARVIDSLGLHALSRKTVGAMSYGEFRRLLLARALVHAPELLILDEPFDGLDARGKAAMANALERVATRGTSLLVVSHHAAELPRCLTHAVHFRDGRIVSAGPLGAAASRGG